MLFFLLFVWVFFFFYSLQGLRRFEGTMLRAEVEGAKSAICVGGSRGAGRSILEGQEKHRRAGNWCLLIKHFRTGGMT